MARRKKFNRDEVEQALNRSGISGKAAESILGELVGGPKKAAESDDDSATSTGRVRGQGSTTQPSLKLEF